MTKHQHPDYRPVVFRDKSAGLVLLTRPTAQATQTIDYEGARYPLVHVEISGASHPFWTGRDRLVDTEGRVERFNRRYGRRGAAQ